MPEPRLLPLGFIDRTTDDGAIIMLTNPSESRNILPETPVTLRVRNTGTDSRNGQSPRRDNLRRIRHRHLQGG